MNTRIWTIEELNRVHPLPEEWAWGLSGQEPYASKVNSRIVRVTNGRIRQIERVGGKWLLDVDIESDVALAVLLACKGLDSLAAMDMTDLPEPKPRRPFDDSDAERAKAGLPHYQESDRDYLKNNNDLAVALLDAYMIRRGRVKS